MLRLFGYFRRISHYKLWRKSNEKNLKIILEREVILYLFKRMIKKTFDKIDEQIKTIETQTIIV